MMTCGNCGKGTHRCAFKIDKDGAKSEWCTECGNVSHTYVPDVFWPGYQHTNPNITDRMGNPINLESRLHKAKVMKQQGISEAGDRFHGTRAGNYTYFNKENGSGKKYSR